MNRRILIVLAVVAVVGYAALMLTYEVFGVDVPSFMEDQPSVHIQEAPRRLLPEQAVPVSRPIYLCPPMPCPCREGACCMAFTVLFVMVHWGKGTGQ